MASTENTGSGRRRGWYPRFRNTTKRRRSEIIGQYITDRASSDESVGFLHSKGELSTLNDNFANDSKYRSITLFRCTIRSSLRRPFEILWCWKGDRITIPETHLKLWFLIISIRFEDYRTETRLVINGKQMPRIIANNTSVRYRTFAVVLQFSRKSHRWKVD